MSSRVINTILNLKDQFSSTINKVAANTKKFQREIKLAENQAARMRNSISSSFTSTGAKIAGALGAAGIFEFAKQSLELASNLAEVQNVVDTTFGDMAIKINDFAKTTSSQFGMSELQAKKFSGTLGAMMKASGVAGDQLTKMSMDLTGLAGDFASFYNLDPEEAFEKIKAGMVGSSEPLLSLGINMQDAQLKAYALAKGFKTNWEQMKIGEKTMVRYQYLMEKSKDAQGDFAKTKDSFANVIRSTSLDFKMLGANIMNYSIPGLAAFVSKIKELIGSIDIKSVMESKVVPAFKSFGTIISYAKDNMTWLLPAIAGVASGFMAFMGIGKVISIIRSFSKSIGSLSLLLNPISLLSAGIGLLVMGLITAYKNSSSFRETINNLWQKISGFGEYMGNNLPKLLDRVNIFFIDTLCPAMAKIGQIVEENILPSLSNFAGAFLDLAKTIWDNITPAWDWIKNNVLPDNFNIVGDAIKYVLDKSTDLFNFITNNWKEIEPIILTIVGALGAYKLALMAVQIWTVIVGATTGIFSTIELAIWGVVNATSAWEAIQWLLNVAMYANPIGVVIMAIAALGLAIYELITHWQDIWNWIQWVWSLIDNNPILKFISFAINPLGTAIMELITHWNDIIGVIQKAWDWLTSWIDKWNGTKLDDKNVNINKNETITGTDENGNDYTSTQYKATGTQYARGGWTITGEHGPELQYMQPGTKVLTNSQTKKMINGNNGGINVYLTVQGNMVGNEEFANQIGQHVFNQIQLAMPNAN